MSDHGVIAKKIPIWAVMEHSKKRIQHQWPLIIQNRGSNVSGHGELEIEIPTLAVM